jgi:hypothetical protein
MLPSGRSEVLRGINWRAWAHWVRLDRAKLRCCGQAVYASTDGYIVALAFSPCLSESAERDALAARRLGCGAVSGQDLESTPAVDAGGVDEVTAVGNSHHVLPLSSHAHQVDQPVPRSGRRSPAQARVLDSLSFRLLTAGKL